MPVEVFSLLPTLADHLASVRAQTDAEAEQRLSVIRDWAASRCGMAAALSENPILLTVQNGQVTVQDGWHRLGLAVFEARLTEVTALCANMPDIDP